MSATVYHFPDSPRTALACRDCGETHYSPNVEAFETTGRLVCDDCYEAETSAEDAEWFV